MNLEHLGRLLKSLTYKPDCEFTYDFGTGPGNEMLCLQLRRWGPDSERRGEMVPVVCGRRWPLFELEQMPETVVLARLVSMFRDFELHEMREWLRVGGKVVEEPHPELFGHAREWPILNTVLPVHPDQRVPFRGNLKFETKPGQPPLLDDSLQRLRNRRDERTEALLATFNMDLSPLLAPRPFKPAGPEPTRFAGIAVRYYGTKGKGRRRG